MMAAEFGKLPCKVLWRLSNKEIPDEDSIAELGLADNTKVGLSLDAFKASRLCNCWKSQQTDVQGALSTYIKPDQSRTLRLAVDVVSETANMPASEKAVSGMGGII